MSRIIRDDALGHIPVAQDATENQKRQNQVFSSHFFALSFTLKTIVTQQPQDVNQKNLNEINRLGVASARAAPVDDGMHTHAFGREHHAACAHDYSVPDLGDMTCSLCDLL